MLFDTHAHYYAEAFDPDRDAVLSALPAAGVGLVLCPGCDLDTSRQSIQLAEAYPHVYAAAGVHPEDALGLPVDWLDQVAEMTRHPKVKAIGEIGLDYYWKEVPRDLQKEVFRAQLQLAKVLDLPVIVHDREAHADCLAIVREFPGVRGVFHCYSGSAEDAKTLVKLGWHLSFTGTITFKNARKAPEVIAAVPLERIMVETDAPTWPPLPFGASGATPLCLPNGGDHCGDQGAHPGGSGAGHHGEWQGALCHSITGGPSGPEDFWGGVFRARGYCDL
ncbi:MAG: TatD family hydrolase [Evtepia gabavorous]